MSWTKIKSKDDLPEEGKYVIAKHNRGTWHSRSDPKNVNTVIVKLAPATPEPNNKTDYKWLPFGPGSFFGQTITHWMPIPDIEGE